MRIRSTSRESERRFSIVVEITILAKTTSSGAMPDCCESGSISILQGEGRDEPMRIVIPRGGYVPVFESLIDVVKISASFTQTVHNEDARVELIATENESDAKETMDW